MWEETNKQKTPPDIPSWEERVTSSFTICECGHFGTHSVEFAETSFMSRTVFANGLCVFEKNVHSLVLDAKFYINLLHQTCSVYC